MQDWRTRARLVPKSHRRRSAADRVMSSDVQVAHVFGVGLDELLARRDLIAHEYVDHLIGGGGGCQINRARALRFGHARSTVRKIPAFSDSAVSSHNPSRDRSDGVARWNAPSYTEHYL